MPFVKITKPKPPTLPFDADLLKDTHISDLPEERLEELGDLLAQLSHKTGDLAEDRDLSFLAEIWLAECMKGEGADKEAMEKIEGFVVSSEGFRGPFQRHTGGLPIKINQHSASRAFQNRRSKVPEAFKKIIHTTSFQAKEKKEEKNVILTSVTLGYQADKWGVERMALDGIQNHLPADSNGTMTGISFLAGGKWIDWRRYSQGAVNAIKFYDDGTGYSKELLGIFHSSKKGDPDAAGFFGEGLKMLSAACIREDVNLELRSRDWSAKPFVIQKNIDEQDVRQLAFRTSGSAISAKGSETIFWNPAPELVEYVKKIDTKVLFLKQGFEYIHKNEEGGLVDEAGDLFARQIFITSARQERMMFSYDLDLRPNRDRDHLDENEVHSKVGAFWVACHDPSVLAKLFEAHDRDPEKFKDSVERSAIWNRDGSFDKNAVASAFKLHYGENAVLQTDSALDKLVKHLGHRPVKITGYGMESSLKMMGIPTDLDIIGESNKFLYLGEKVDFGRIARRVRPTDLSLDYRAGAWNELRIFLDTVSNHLPLDSKGTKVVVEYLEDVDSDAPEWKSAAPKDGKIAAIRVSDDGSGFSIDKLFTMRSTKDWRSVGQFGEGLKMLSAACLREGITVKFSSRDWFATPITQTKTDDGEEVKMLSYIAVENAKRRIGSATTFYNPSDSLIQLFKEREKYFLALAPDAAYLHKNKEGAILSKLAGAETNRTYVKGVFICDNTQEAATAFTYDMNLEEITPDRGAIDSKMFTRRIASLLGSCENQEVPHRILEATSRKEEVLEAGLRINLQNEKVKASWKKAFENVYGKKAVLANGNPSIDYEAEHTGYWLVHVGNEMASTLKSAGVKSAEGAIFANYNTVEVKPKDFTDLERMHFALLKEMDNVLGLNYAGRVRIFESATTDTGEAVSSPAFYNGKNLWIRRDRLSEIWRFAQAFQHESGHANTGATDPSDDFRGFFESYMASFMVREIQLRQNNITLPPLKPYQGAKSIPSPVYNMATETSEIDRQKLKAITETATEEGNDRKRIETLTRENLELREELARTKGRRWYNRFRISK